MTIREFLKMPNVCVDICDDYDERSFIGYDDGTELTEEAEKDFATALNLTIIESTITENVVVVHCETEKEAENLKALFHAMAGLCTEEEYQRYFK